MIGDCEKLSVLMMFRGLLTDIRNIHAGTIVDCPSNKTSLRTFLLDLWSKKNIHCVSFDDVLRSHLEKDLSELLKGHLTYHYILF